VFSKAAVRRIEDHIVLVNAAGCRANGLGAQAFQDALEGFEVADFKFNFGFVRHGIPSLGEIGRNRLARRRLSTGAKFR